MAVRAWLGQQDHGWSVGLAAWTLFAWANRIGNVLDDEELTGFARTWRVGVAVGFVAAGLAIIALLLTARVSEPRLRRATIESAGRQLALVLAVVGSAWWLVRGGQILVGDWEVGFKVVHTVLALVTIGLSSMVVRSTVRRHRPDQSDQPVQAAVGTDAGAL